MNPYVGIAFNKEMKPVGLSRKMEGVAMAFRLRFRAELGMRIGLRDCDLTATEA